MATPSSSKVAVEGKGGLKMKIIGEGRTVPGPIAADPDHPALCYQCCKRVPLSMLVRDRTRACGEKECARAREARLEFIPMPSNAVNPCDEFQTKLDWWIDMMDSNVDRDFARRGRGVVEFVREKIPVPPQTRPARRAR
ncbi:Uu.00g121940.m01.CDS01 [Anthostomella pinea]|uniref:Uu.00g121940.m01.CDS01 n=1 Tax=Anthostomella pinea TaxID=933095 RepID=A0AAI8YH96_9PEZI|nr:Uu.00g121940.m01.CDS01 [Anthostomella pinea]